MIPAPAFPIMAPTSPSLRQGATSLALRWVGGTSTETARRWPRPTWPGWLPSSARGIPITPRSRSSRLSWITPSIWARRAGTPATAAGASMRRGRSPWARTVVCSPSVCRARSDSGMRVPGMQGLLYPMRPSFPVRSSSPSGPARATRWCGPPCGSESAPSICRASMCGGCACRWAKSEPSWLNCWQNRWWRTPS